MRDEEPTIPHLSIEDLLGEESSSTVSIAAGNEQARPDSGVLRLVDMIARSSTTPPDSPERLEVSSTDMPPARLRSRRSRVVLPVVGSKN